MGIYFDLDSEADIILLEKLIHVANVTNDDILSEGELAHCRRLLVKAQEQLLSIEPESNELEQSRLTCRIQTLSFALSAQRRLPPEILEHIFGFLIPYTKSWMWLPPTKATLSMHPWSLGQVCRTWRRVSRSIPELWGIININFVNNRNDYFDIENEFKYDPESTLKALRCANEILPPSVPVRVSGPDWYELNTKDVVTTPHLNCITDLVWHFDDNVPSDVYESLFSRLVSLDFSSDPELDFFESRRNLFGPSPKLQTLNLSSDTPFLLLTDIPWHQLCSFSLAIVSPPEDLSLWRKFTALDGSICMHSLKELHLQLPDNLASIFSFGFPWQQLTSVSLTIHYQPESQYLTEMWQALQKCASLNRLSFIVHMPQDCPIQFQLPRSMPFTLHSLLLKGPAFSTINSFCFLGELCELTTGHITEEEFYTIVEKCPFLSKLSCFIMKPGNLGPDALQAPHPHVVMQNLKSLSLLTINPKLLRDITTPALTFLEIESVNFPYPMVEILHFIERSNAKLQTFECRSNLSGLSEELLLNLLSVLDTSKIVRLPCVQHGSTLANALSDENVLPNVEDLTIFDIDSLPHSFVPFLSSRLEREATRGRFKLKRFALYTRRADPANERERLKEIGKKYGVACTAQKFYFKPIFY